MTGLGRFGVKLGLERTRAILQRAGNPEASLRGALIAGTNGKGSTAAMLAAILRRHGHRVGTMPSPHLVSYRERIQVDGVPISEAEFAAAVEWLQPRLEGISPELGAPTEFEILTTVALTYLARRCDRLVIEVGMGGRLDATNVLDLGVSVITNVALDHQQYLGDSVEKIAAEKAGIIKPGDAVVTGAEGAALTVVESAASNAGAEVWRLGRELRLTSRWRGWEGSEIDLSGPGFEYHGLKVPLLGTHQAANAALAVAAANRLGEVPDGLDAVRWPGRLEPIGRRPTVLLDGGHNPAALAALAEDVPRLAEGRPVTVVFGMMADKDIPASLAELRRLAPAGVIFTAADSPRAAKPLELAALWAGGEAVENAILAARRGLELTGPDGLLLVCGSLYLVGAVRDFLIEDAARR
ncbi:MAG TPA: folylpolyglutamate synthase/dihydrofolate synthase family protein [Candidatus Dormibacteraeota bacterium]|nr:folylpolyglutamate synthase/dihydrofolate synthase family protein [Candidatus Dormibacteraeota bacterium]